MALRDAWNAKGFVAIGNAGYAVIVTETVEIVTVLGREGRILLPRGSSRRLVQAIIGMDNLNELPLMVEMVRELDEVAGRLEKAEEARGLRHLDCFAKPPIKPIKLPSAEDLELEERWKRVRIVDEGGWIRR